MLTLLRMFLIPRVKTLSIQLGCLLCFVILSLVIGEYSFAVFGVGLSMTVIFYNLMNANLSENIEWLKNSVYSSMDLLKYYFLEQTLMLIIAFGLLILSIQGMAWVISGHEDQIIAAFADFASNEQGKMIAAKVTRVSSFSATEAALEYSFIFCFIIGLVYGGELVKTYFMNLKYEKKFSHESKFFQGLMFFSFLFYVLKDFNGLMFLNQLKIILIPFLMSLQLLCLMMAANNGFKFFKPSIKSPLGYFPASVFIIFLGFGVFFGKINYANQKDLNKKVSEHRFLGPFSSELSTKQLVSTLDIKLADDNFYYLLPKYEDDNNITTNDIIESCKESFKQNIYLIKHESLALSEKESMAIFKNVHSIMKTFKTEKKKKRYFLKLYYASKTRWNDEEKINQYVADFKEFMDKERVPASSSQILDINQ